MAISMLKIRRPLGRLIFNMGIAIPGKTVFLIETAPWVTWQENSIGADSESLFSAQPSHIWWYYKDHTQDIIYELCAIEPSC